MIASVLGIPVSSTHMRPIALAWVVTLPAAAILGALCFVVLLNVF